MPDELKRTVVSAPGSAIREIEIELPDSVKQAISENLERGKRAAREELLSASKHGRKGTSY